MVWDYIDNQHQPRAMFPQNGLRGHANLPYSNWWKSSEDQIKPYDVSQKL
jgi:hypothetical protein